MKKEINAIVNKVFYWHDTQYNEGETVLNINLHPAYEQLLANGTISITETEVFTKEQLWDFTIDEAKEYIAKVDSLGVLNQMYSWESENPSFEDGRKGIFDLLDKRKSECQ